MPASWSGSGPDTRDRTGRAGPPSPGAVLAHVRVGHGPTTSGGAGVQPMAPTSASFGRIIAPRVPGASTPSFPSKPFTPPRSPAPMAEESTRRARAKTSARRTGRPAQMSCSLMWQEVLSASGRGGDHRSGRVQPVLRSPDPELALRAPRAALGVGQDGQPTQRIIEIRRRAEFITPIPKPKKTPKAAEAGELRLRRGQGALDQGAAVRPDIDHQRGARSRGPRGAACRTQLSGGSRPETARLLQHWRHHKFSEHPPVLLPGRGGRDGHLAHRGRSQA